MGRAAWRVRRGRGMVGGAHPTRTKHEQVFCAVRVPRLLERVEKAIYSSFFTSRRAIRWTIANLTHASLLVVVPS